MITLGDDLVEDVEHALIVHLLFLKLLLALADVHDSLAKHRADFVAHGLAFAILPGKLGTISLSSLHDCTILRTCSSPLLSPPFIYVLIE